jgi:hypothetical protein
LQIVDGDFYRVGRRRCGGCAGLDADGGRRFLRDGRKRNLLNLAASAGALLGKQALAQGQERKRNNFMVEHEAPLAVMIFDSVRTEQRAGVLLTELKARLDASTFVF